ncbi:MAG TPA: PIN domain-containing protein [Thermoanaerobaculia bacterium]|nr:PIN domain-containing protein [Thermoanaerobaculia bacterium]
MILVDTSVWVEYFRGTDRTAELGDLLDEGDLLLHPWVLGELVLGGLGKSRKSVIADLRRLPESVRVADEEVLELIEARGLSGRAIGWVDVHLLASALVGGSELWTFDGGLTRVAKDLGIATR